MADPREKQFQDDIVKALVANGWMVGNSAEYDKQHALYPEDALGFFQEAHPEQWAKFKARYPSDPEGSFLKSVAKQLGKKDTLEVLRHGFKDRGAKVTLAQFKPDHELNPDATARYELNRLRVVPEVTYSPHGAPGRLDLVLFVNGVPTATLELKSEFKQAVERAKQQYRNDRPPKDPATGKAEPLLAFKRGALVHFAASQTEVFMTTRLAGKDTTFLPFNMGGEDGGRGNPPNPDGYDTSYLWQRVFQPDAWLRIVGRFVHLETKSIEDGLGRTKTKEAMIFPRFHQWDAVTKLVGTVREEGAGRRYLVQHSAGSGKSNSIAWTAHQLASMYEPDGTKVFRSVIVITDRTVLDSQLQETIYQFDHKSGVVAAINREDASESKSQQLADALEKGVPIVVVTLQTFPYVLELVQQSTTLKGERFAVIADEAHSSQSGRTAVKMRQVLLSEQVDDPAELTGEDVLNQLLEARKQAGTISYFAFTATPKGKTLELFGRPPDPSRPPADDNKPEAFHVYTMRQAIEEGFILDVLKNYTTYDTAYQLGLADETRDDEVPERKAGRKLAQWARLHPHNIQQKVVAIVEHFREHIAPQLGGQAKGMIVTSGRRDAVRYKLAVDAYAAEQGYAGIQALVAFSGEVNEHLGDLSGFEGEQARSQSKAGDNGAVQFNERTMNRSARGDLRRAFDEQGYNLMIVANKFQTGFDQPKLVAMYVDKKLSGVDAVQTLSRLNRTYPGKENTFVLDFMNDAEQIRQAFEPYYRTTLLSEVSDPNLVYDLVDNLEAERIFENYEVEAFANVFFDPKGQQADLLKHMRAPVERFRNRLAAASAKKRDAEQRIERSGDPVTLQNAQRDATLAGEELDRLEKFRENLRNLGRFYEFMSQVIDFDDPELERLVVFARHLLPLLPRFEEDDGDVDLSNVRMTAYRLHKQREQDIRLEDDPGVKGIKSLGSGGVRDEEDVWLSELIDRMNDLMGSEFSDADKINFVENTARKLSENDRIVQQIRNNAPDQVMRGDFGSAVQDAVMKSGNAHEGMMLRVMESQQTADAFARLVLRTMLRGLEATPRGSEAK